MTRTEFIESINDFYDLKEFAYNNDADPNDLDSCLVYGDDYDSVVEEDIREFLEWNSWSGLASYLEDLPSRGWDAYYRNGCLEYSDISDSFDEYKQNVLEYMDEYGEWDNDDDEEDEESEVRVSRPAPPVLTQYYGSCKVRLNNEEGLEEIVPVSFSLDELSAF